MKHAARKHTIRSMTLVRWMIAGLSVVAMLLAGAMFSSDAPKHAAKAANAAAASAHAP